MPHEHPFYDHEISSDEEQRLVESILKKYRHEHANEELKKKIWDELSMEKYHGRIKIPFKVVLRVDQQGKFPSVIEVILDTKV